MVESGDKIHDLDCRYDKIDWQRNFEHPYHHIRWSDKDSVSNFIDIALHRPIIQNMRRRIQDVFGSRRVGLIAAGFAVALGLSGCALEQPGPSVGYMPTNSFSHTAIGEDPAIAAIDDATSAFAHPRAMQGHPARMALAVASLDAMAGQFATGGRWLSMNSLAKQQMLEARSAVRRQLGIVPGTPSQTVVDDLVGASQALGRGDQAGAVQALTSPAFTLGPARTLALLAQFPAMPIANHATMFASRYLFPGGSAFGPGIG